MVIINDILFIAKYMNNNKTDRIEYIDQLRGFAILWVVMGHISEKSLGINDTLFNQFYGSFHMPLFMFLSGIFSFKSFYYWNLSEIVHFLFQKFLRIVLPFITIGGIYCYFTNKTIDYSIIDNYWFLPALFYSMVYALFVKYLFIKLFPLRLELLGHILFFIILCVLYLQTSIGKTPYYLESVKMYPFFVFGIFFGKTKRIQLYVKTSRELFFLLLFFYLFLMFFKIDLPINVIAFLAIGILVYIFNHCKLPNIFNYLGRNSLHIYVFHWFFITPLGLFFQKLQYLFYLFDKSNFLFLLIFTFIVAIPIVFLCLSISRLIKASKYINLLCFGGF